jgi:hypothetical protein
MSVKFEIWEVDKARFRAPRLRKIEAERINDKSVWFRNATSGELNRRAKMSEFVDYYYSEVEALEYCESTCLERLTKSRQLVEHYEQSAEDFARQISYIGASK